MAADKPDRFRTVVTLLLIAIIITAAIIAWSKYTPNRPVEISLPPTPKLTGEIYISGQVNNPGLYPLTSDDSLEAVIRAAGGITDTANLSLLKLDVPGGGEAAENPEGQRININRAEAWLLEALPGIGETLAQRIVDYRRQNGPFRNSNQLLKVDGIGAATYEGIKDLVSVSD